MADLTGPGRGDDGGAAPTPKPIVVITVAKTADGHLSVQTQGAGADEAMGLLWVAADLLQRQLWAQAVEQHRRTAVEITRQLPRGLG